MGTEPRGARQQKANRELGWTLRCHSWREGFQLRAPRPISRCAGPADTNLRDARKSRVHPLLRPARPCP